MKLLVCSLDDPASVNIRSQLLKIASFKEADLAFEGQPVLMLGDVALVTVRGELTHADMVDGFLNASLAVFLSRHEASSGMPSLLAHVPGNWTNRAEAGGRPRSLCRAPASSLKEALKELAKQRSLLGLDSWQLGVEATHHGPFLEQTPALFIEVGSRDADWSNEAACMAVAKAALKAVEAKVSYRSLIGVGGPHYAPKFTQLLLESEWGVSYIASRYVVDDLDEEVLSHALKRSIEGVEALALDWKGLKGEQRRRIVEAAKHLGLRALKVEEFLRR